MSNSGCNDIRSTIHDRRDGARHTAKIAENNWIGIQQAEFSYHISTWTADRSSFLSSHGNDEAGLHSKAEAGMNVLSITRYI